MKNAVVLILLIITTANARAQPKVSFATDVSVMANFSPKQQFFAIGQTIQFNFHFTPKTSFYSWFIYYSPGKFENDCKAIAKSPSITPPEINYEVKGTWNMREFSLGWKPYLKGRFDAEYDWNLYGLVGLGFMYIRAENSLKQPVDTSLYTIAATPEIGKGTINRLTVDLGLGVEIPLGGDFFAYGDLRTALPASSYASPYLHSTKNVPMSVMLNVGLRILFANY